MSAYPTFWCTTHGLVSHRDVCMMLDGSAWCHEGGGCGQDVIRLPEIPEITNAIEAILVLKTTVTAMHADLIRIHAIAHRSTDHPALADITAITRTWLSPTS